MTNFTLLTFFSLFMITSAYAHEVMTVVGTDSGPSQSLSDATVIVDGTVMEWASDVDGGSMISIEQPEVSDHFGASSISREILSAERIDQVDLSYDSEGHTSLHPITVNRSSTSWDGGQEYTGSEFLDGHNDDDSGQISATDDTRSQPIYTSLMTGMMDEYQTINDRSPTGADEHVAVTTEQRTLKVTFITRFDDDYTLYFEWDAPPTSRTSQGKSSGIQGYHFEHRVGTSSWSKTTMGLTSSMDLARVFTGRGVTFSFRIRARYGDAGNEPWSNIVTFTTYDVPDAPTNLQAEASGETTINLSWSAPSEDGGLPIKKYRVESSPDGTSGWKYVGIRSGATSTTYSHRFLDPRTTRYYRVIAYNDIGYGESSNVASATTEGKAVAPDAPTGLSATAMGGNEIHLSWTAPSENGGAEIIGYRIETSRYANFNWSELEDDTGNDETTYEHTNLSPGSTRFYRVSAINSAGTSVVSNTVSATTLSLPGAPTNLTATASGSTRINLSWRAPSDNGGAAITGYRIETWIGSSWTTVQENTGSTTPSYTVRNLRPSTSRYYRVFTITSVGTGPRSLSVLGTTGVPGDGTATAPDAPTGLSAQASGRTTINLSWTAPDDGGSTITGFRIEVSTDGGKTFKELVASQTLMTFTHRGLSAGTMCYYRVFAINSEGRSSPSTPASATTPAREPDAPTGLTARASGSTTINLSWTAPDNGGAAIRGYLIEESTDGGSTFSELVASHSTTTYSHTGLDPGTTRHYRVSAINSVNTGSPSTAVSATTEPASTVTAPAAPTGLTARASGSATISLSWTAPDDGGATITGYLIEVSTDGGSTFSELVPRHSTTTYSHTGLDPSTTRHYRVSAINSAGTGSASTVVSATTEPASILTVSSAPTGLTATASGSTTITLSWTSPSDDGGAEITGYRIEVSPNGASEWIDLASNTGSTATSYSHTNLLPETTRYYRVSAINSVGESDLSNIDNATTDPVASLSFITSIGDQTYPVGIAIADLVLPEASGGVMPKEYTLTPSLPTGLTIDRSTRTINGTPSDITSETMYTWTVEDAAGTIVNLKFSLEVYSLSFDETIENLSLSRGQTITTIILPEANGGVSPIQYTLNLLDLPLGLMYDASTRSITGTPLVISPPVPFTFTALDSNGAQDSLKFTIEVISTVHSEENPDLTENFVVHSNYPNPFVHSTHLVFDLPWSAQVSVEVLDITGRQVYERPPIHINAGTGHELELNDLKVPSGSYIYRMIATSRDNGSEAIHVGHFMSVR